MDQERDWIWRILYYCLWCPQLPAAHPRLLGDWHWSHDIRWTQGLFELEPASIWLCRQPRRERKRGERIRICDKSAARWKGSIEVKGEWRIIKAIGKQAERTVIDAARGKPSTRQHSLYWSKLCLVLAAALLSKVLVHSWTWYFFVHTVRRYNLLMLCWILMSRRLVPPWASFIFWKPYIGYSQRKTSDPGVLLRHRWWSMTMEKKTLFPFLLSAAKHCSMEQMQYRYGLLLMLPKHWCLNCLFNLWYQVFVSSHRLRTRWSVRSIGKTITRIKHCNLGQFPNLTSIRALTNLIASVYDKFDTYLAPASSSLPDTQSFPVPNTCWWNWQPLKIAGLSYGLRWKRITSAPIIDVRSLSVV